MDELLFHINTSNLDILVLTEVAPKNNRYLLKKSELEIKGYSLYINNFEEKGVRGVANYVKKNIATVQIYPRESAPDTAWVEIKASKNKKMIIGGIYRSPNNSCDNNEKLWKTITYMASLYKDNMLLMGDFNCSGIDWTNQLTVDQDTNSLNNKLIETLRDCYLEQVITENTRARGSHIPSLLDLVLCYDRKQISNIAYLGPLGKSDHCVVTLLYNITFESCSYKVKRNMYDQGDYTAIKKHLCNIGWDIILSGKSVQQQWDVLVDIIGNLEDQYIPSKMVEINKDDKFGEKLPNHIRLQIKKKHNMWKRYMETRSLDIYRTFCRSRNKVKNFKNTIASLHSDPKDQTSNLIDNSREKANILNSYFASVYTKEPPDEIPKLAHRKAPKQSKMNITVEMVKFFLHDLNIHKSPGPDGIHPRFMQELSAELCIPLTMIFEKSIETAQLPDQWKVARVSAIFEKGNKKLASNYRPVSITSIVCRTFEKIIRYQIVSFLMEHGLLSNFQFGFKKGRSTTLQLLNVLNDWTQSMENKNSTDCVYMDYQKAFDKVPHGRLLAKLEAYNLSSEVINWIKEYLTGRSQCVEVNGKASEWLRVTSGIHQGSVLGSLLFLIYINDLPDDINSDVYMYADDSKLYREIKTIEDQRILQKDLDTD